jgi:hypothetical protein
MRVQLLVAVAVVALLAAQGRLCDLQCAAQPDPLPSHSLKSASQPEPCHEAAGSTGGEEAEPDCPAECPSCSAQGSFLKSATELAGSCPLGIQVAVPATLGLASAAQLAPLHSGRRFEAPPRRSPLLKASLLL